MGRFLNKLYLEDLGEQLWEVQQPYGYMLDQYIYVIMPKFRTDGTSLPRLTWTLAGESPMAGSTKYGAVPHDGGYKGVILILSVAKLKEHGITPEQSVTDPLVLPADCFVHYDRKVFPRSHWDYVLKCGWRDAHTYGGDVDRIPVAKRLLMISFVRAFGWIPWRKYARSHR